MRKPGLLLSLGLLLVVVLIQPGCKSAHTTSAILYYNEQQYDKAVNVLHEGLEYNPDEPDAYYWLGETHSKLAEVAIENNDFAEAQHNYELSYQYYKKAEELDPKNFTEKANLAMQHNQILQSNKAKSESSNGYYEQAEGYFRLAYAALPDSTSSIKNLARMKMRMAAEQGNDKQLFEEALELLDKVLERHPEAYELLADKANVLVALDRPAEADAIYTELIKDHGDDPALLIDVANLSHQEGQYERAADLYRRVADIYAADDLAENDEDIRDLLVGAAEDYANEDVHRYADALELFDRALQREISPSEQTQLEYMRTYYDYGIYLKKQAEDETDPVPKADLQAKAEAQFKRSLEVGNALVDFHPSAAMGYYQLFLVNQELGDSKAAEANFNKFTELQPELKSGE
jgi:tetratricopeptide (TPR) repeat protein